MEDRRVDTRSLILSFITLCVFFTAREVRAEVKLGGQNWQLIMPVAGSPSENSLRSFLENAESSYVPFFTALGLERARQRSLKIRLFPNLEAYKAYQRAHSKSQSNHAFYSLFNAEILTYEFGNEPLLLSNIFHEATHHFIRDFVPRETIPRCLDEGLAEIFESGEWNGSQVRLGTRNSRWARAVRAAAEANTLKPITFFLEMNPKAFIHFRDSEETNFAIAQCWAMSYFLYFADDGHWRGVLGKLLIGSGQPLKPEALIDESLPKETTRRDLEEKWQAFAAKM